MTLPSQGGSEPVGGPWTDGEAEWADDSKAWSQGDERWVDGDLEAGTDEPDGPERDDPEQDGRGPEAR
jgi:hypothetical protein